MSQSSSRRLIVPREPIRGHIRWMTRRDFPAILAIEAASSESPWGEDDFIRPLRERNVIGAIAERGDEVLGFMVYRLHPSHVELINLAIAPGHRRRGVGRQMVAKLVGKLSITGRTSIRLHIRESLLAAQLFCRAEGFRATRVDREWCDDTGEDAYAMRYDLDGFAPEDDA